MGTYVNSLGGAAAPYSPDESKIFQEVVRLITSVLTRADTIYSDAKGLLDEAVANAVVGSIPDAVTVSVDSPTKPDDLVFQDIPVDITMGTVSRPGEVVLDNINTTVTVGEVTPPDVTFALPPTPSLPAIDDVPPPDVTFSYDETFYSSDLGKLLYATLMEEIANGSTGLSATVETDIWARESERDALALQAARDRMANVWAESGMAMPSGVLIGAVNQLEVDYQNRLSDKSRDVRIESFKRADDNAKFVKDLTVKYEQVLMNYMTEFWNRALRASEALLNGTVTIYNAMIAYQSLYTERAKAEAQIYSATVSGQAAMSDAQTRLFTAEVQYELGKADEVVKVGGLEVDIQKTKVAKGQLDVSLYDTDTKYQVAAAGVEAQSIQMQLEGQKTHAAVYQAQMQGYATESQFNLGKADVLLKSIQTDLELLKLQVQSAIAISGDMSHVSATMAAGSISALNANTSMGISESYGYNSSVSDSRVNSFSLPPQSYTMYDGMIL